MLSPIKTLHKLGPAWCQPVYYLVHKNGSQTTQKRVGNKSCPQKGVTWLGSHRWDRKADMRVRAWVQPLPRCHGGPTRTNVLGDPLKQQGRGLMQLSELLCVLAFAVEHYMMPF